ncbi:YwiC-like family protein [Tessaracoccus massiliensis]|uniref:YwiC-like family protein n=1 Tax=Tessaracoccus massiliensis TaxID=1522311 RepID=UPI00058D63BD|nr:YwiC-like family protein [Tessaracoccus massiliensis]
MAKKGATKGWLPNQHGAWAMIIVPFLVGLLLVLPYRPLDWGDLALGVTWLIGYFAFDALVFILKSPPKRRPAYYPAFGTYAAIAGVAGLTTLFFRSWEILWWAPVYAVLLGTALYLAGTKRERSVLSGVLTIFASCGLMPVLRSTAGAGFIRANETAVMVAITAYFIGTVFHVKALIRERNNPRSAPRSLIYHAALAVAVIAAVVAGWLTWGWIVWAAALVVRAWWLPRERRKPLQIGIVEIVMSTWVLLVVLL